MTKRIPADPVHRARTDAAGGGGGKLAAPRTLTPEQTRRMREALDAGDYRAAHAIAYGVQHAKSDSQSAADALRTKHANAWRTDVKSSRFDAQELKRLKRAARRVNESQSPWASLTGTDRASLVEEIIRIDGTEEKQLRGEHDLYIAAVAIGAWGREEMKKGNR